MPQKPAEIPFSLEPILKARSWDELFEAANAALEDPSASPETRALRSLFWRKCAFPVAAAERVSFRDPSDSAKGPLLPESPSASGKALMSVSFSLAKDLAATLCGARDEASAALALEEIRSRLAAGAERVASLSGLAPLLAEGIRPLLFGWNAFLALEDVASLAGEALETQGRPPSLSHSAASAASAAQTHPADPESGKLLEHLRRLRDSRHDAFERLRHAFGFSMVSCGPDGGARQGIASAEAIQEAFFALSRKLSAPAETLGLGGLGILLNCDLGPAGGALHGNGWSLGFSHPPGSVAHEWTHAFERHVEILGTPAQKASLAAVRDAVASLPRDPALAERFAHAPVEAEERRQIAFLAKVLSVRGTPEAQALGAAGEIPESLRDAWLSAMRFPDPDGMIGALQAAIETHSAPGYLPPDGLALARQEERMAEAFYSKSLRERALRESDLSVFALLAREADESLAFSMPGDPPRYWSSPREMLARAAEAFFHDDATPSLAWVSPEDFSSPKLSELESLKQPLSRFFDSLSDLELSLPRGRRSDMTSRIPQ